MKKLFSSALGNTPSIFLYLFPTLALLFFFPIVHHQFNQYTEQVMHQYEMAEFSLLKWGDSQHADTSWQNKAVREKAWLYKRMKYLEKISQMMSFINWQTYTEIHLFRYHQLHIRW